MLAKQVMVIFLQLIIFTLFPDHNVCQVTRGKYLSPSDYLTAPYTVSLQHQDGFHMCSGGLTSSVNLGAQYVISVAQCFANKIYPVYAVIWDTFLGHNSTGRAQKRLITKIVVHPDFNRNGFRQDDIAILFLESNFIGAIPLATHGPPCSNCPLVEPYNPLTITGWGSMFQGATNDSLLQVFTSHVRNGWNDCRSKWYSETGKDVFNPDKMFCYYGPKENQNDERLCFGDAGAPVKDNYVENHVGYPKFAGVVSFGHGKHF